jgi:hypothetical protein
VDVENVGTRLGANDKRREPEDGDLKGTHSGNSMYPIANLKNDGELQ